ncbi:hypothetical protein ABZ092_14815 [Streptomyces bobili]|uniref:hypothetical protein n=1 Tax=Streptomyces bobili TaxID=67280 RepID=UPI0033B3A14B
MKLVRQVMAALLAATTTAAAAGCANKGLDVPSTFCGAPVKQSALSPLLPDGDDLKSQQTEPAPSEIDCSLHIDGVQVLDTLIRRIDEPLSPEDWTTALSKYDKASKRSVSFPGTAVIGSDGARVTAKCEGGESNFLLFNITFDGNRVENSQAGVVKLQHFLEDYVPAMAQRLDCTT